MANGYCWCPFFCVDCNRRLLTPNILSRCKRVLPMVFAEYLLLACFMRSKV